MKADKETARIAMHRKAVRDAFDVHVRGGGLSSAQREVFERTLGVDDDARVMAINVATIAKLAAPPKRPDRVAFSAQRDEQGRQLSDVLADPGTALADEIAKLEAKAAERGEECGPERYAAFARANRQLVRAWMDALP